MCNMQNEMKTYAVHMTLMIINKHMTLDQRAGWMDGWHGGAFTSWVETGETVIPSCPPPLSPLLGGNRRDCHTLLPTLLSWVERRDCIIPSSPPPLSWVETSLLLTPFWTESIMSRVSPVSLRSNGMTIAGTNTYYFLHWNIKTYYMMIIVQVIRNIFFMRTERDRQKYHTLHILKLPCISHL